MEEILILPLKFHHLKTLVIKKEEKKEEQQQQQAIPPPPPPTPPIPHCPTLQGNEELGGWPSPPPFPSSSEGRRGRGKRGREEEGGRRKGKGN